MSLRLLRATDISEANATTLATSLAEAATDNTVDPFADEVAPPLTEAQQALLDNVLEYYSLNDEDMATLATAIYAGRIASYSAAYSEAADLVGVSADPEDELDESGDDEDEDDESQRHAAGIVATFNNSLAGQITNLITSLPIGGMHSEQELAGALATGIGAWTTQNAAYKAQQIANAETAGGAQHGTDAAVDNIANGDWLEQAGLSEDDVIVTVLPEYASEDYICSDYAGEQFPLSAYYEIPDYPVHPNCIHEKVIIARGIEYADVDPDELEAEMALDAYMAAQTEADTAAAAIDEEALAAADEVPQTDITSLPPETPETPPEMRLLQGGGQTEAQLRSDFEAARVREQAALDHALALGERFDTLPFDARFQAQVDMGSAHDAYARARFDRERARAAIDRAKTGRGVIVHLEDDALGMLDADERHETAEQALARYFPDREPLSPAEIASMVGAQDGDYVRVVVGDNGLEFTLHGGSEDPLNPEVGSKYGGDRVLTRSKSGVLSMENQFFTVERTMQGTGIGTRVFTDEVQGLSDLGVRRITTDGIRGDGYNGYYTWPRLGYVGKLDDGVREMLAEAVAKGELPAKYEKVSTIQALIKSPEGRAWWKTNGYGISLEFDLRAGSTSHKLLDAYLAAKADIAATKAAAELAAAEAAKAGLSERAMARLRELDALATPQKVTKWLQQEFWRQHLDLPVGVNAADIRTLKEMGAALIRFQDAYKGALDEVTYIGLSSRPTGKKYLKKLFPDTAGVPPKGWMGGVFKMRDVEPALGGMARMGDGLLFPAEMFTDRAKFEEIADRAIARGFWMGDATKDMGYVITHELGHVLQDMAGVADHMSPLTTQRVSKEVQAAYAQWMKDAAAARDGLPLSRYAATHADEYWAEAFAAQRYGTDAQRADVTLVRQRQILDAALNGALLPETAAREAAIEEAHLSGERVLTLEQMRGWPTLDADQLDQLVVSRRTFYEDEWGKKDRVYRATADGRVYFVKEAHPTSVDLNDGVQRLAHLLKQDEFFAPTQGFVRGDEAYLVSPWIEAKNLEELGDAKLAASTDVMSKADRMQVSVTNYLINDGDRATYNTLMTADQHLVQVDFEGVFDTGVDWTPEKLNALLYAEANGGQEAAVTARLLRTKVPPDVIEWIKSDVLARREEIMAIARDATKTINDEWKGEAFERAHMLASLEQRLDILKELTEAKNPTVGAWSKIAEQPKWAQALERRAQEINDALAAGDRIVASSVEAGERGAVVDPARVMQTVKPDADAVKAVHASYTEGIKTWAQFNDMTPAAYKQAVSARFTDMLRDATISVRRTRATLGSILDDGRFKTLFEARRTGVAPGLEASHIDDLLVTRAKFEERAFGYARDLDPAQRPVYGYFADAGKDERNAALYGDARIIFTDAVRERSTVTFGDSLDGETLHKVPRPVDKAQWDSFVFTDRVAGDRVGERATWAQAFDPLQSKTLSDLTRHTGLDYAEAQVHGGLRVSDIKSVVFTGAAPDAALAAKLERAGISWSVEATTPDVRNLLAEAETSGKIPLFALPDVPDAPAMRMLRGASEDTEDASLPVKRRTDKETGAVTETQGRYTVVYDRAGKDAIAAAFGADVTPSELARLVGGQTGATVKVFAESDATARATETGARPLMHLSLQGADDSYGAMRVLYQDQDGSLWMHNDSLWVRKDLRGSSLGTRIFRDETQALIDHNVTRIETTATKNAIANGYYTWLRLGYDAPITDEIRARLPREYKSFTRLSQFMESPALRDWWKANGFEFNGVFDLRAGAQSRQILDAYVDAKTGNGASEAGRAEMARAEATASRVSLGGAKESDAEESLWRERFNAPDAQDAYERVPQTLSDRLRFPADDDQAFRAVMERMGATTREGAVEKLLSAWEMTSAKSATAAALQLAAEKEFDLGRLTTTLDKKLLKEAQAKYGDVEAGLRAFVRAQYEETQAYFAAHDITEVTLYRGASWSKDSANAPADVEWTKKKRGAPRDVRLQPLSSFSSAFSTAYDAGAHGDAYHMVVAERVPVRDILSTPLTGLGTIEESEFTVLGGTRRMSTVTWEGAAPASAADMAKTRDALFASGSSGAESPNMRMLLADDADVALTAERLASEEQQLARDYDVANKRESATKSKKRINEAIHQRLTDNADWQQLVEANKFTEMISLRGKQELASAEDRSRKLVRQYITAWAESSSETTSAGILQLAAEREFGLSHVTTGHLIEYESITVQKSFESFEGAYCAFVRAMYEETQADLAARGITEVVVYRGLSFFGDIPQGIILDGTPRITKIALQPLSSFSSQESIAREFASGDIWGIAEKRQPAALIAERVPAEQIFSTAWTGIGCKNEGEIVVLGGTRDMVVMADTYEGFVGSESLGDSLLLSETRLSDSTFKEDVARLLGPAAEQPKMRMLLAEGDAEATAHLTELHADLADAQAEEKNALKAIRASATRNGYVWEDIIGTEAHDRLINAEFQRETLEAMLNKANGGQGYIVHFRYNPLEEKTPLSAQDYLNRAVGQFEFAKDPDAIGKLIGAPAGSYLYISPIEEPTYLADGHPMPQVKIEMYGPGYHPIGHDDPLAGISFLSDAGDEAALDWENNRTYDAQRTIFRDERNNKVIHNDLFQVGDAYQGSGLGRQVFQQEVESAKALGFDRIETLAYRAEDAAGNVLPGWNGYYTWARFGYDGPIAPKASAAIARDIAAGKLPQEWESFTEVQEVMRAPGGAAWWKENGRSFEGVFDLSGKGQSLSVLDTYTKAKTALAEDATPGSAMRMLLADDGAASGADEAVTAGTAAQDVTSGANEALTFDRETLAETTTTRQVQKWLDAAFPEMTPALGKMDVAVAREVAGQLATLSEQYPDALATLKVLAGSSDKRVSAILKFEFSEELREALAWQFNLDATPLLGMETGSAIAFADAFTDAGWLRDVLADNVRQGHFPAWATSPSYLISHETGHVLQDWLAGHPNLAVRNAYEDLLKRGDNYRFGVLGYPGLTISGYASTDRDEFFAEAFAALQHGDDAIKHAIYLRQVRDLLDAATATNDTDRAVALQHLKDSMTQEQDRARIAVQAYGGDPVEAPALDWSHEDDPAQRLHDDAGGVTSAAADSSGDLVATTTTDDTSAAPISVTFRNDATRANFLQRFETPPTDAQIAQLAGAATGDKVTVAGGGEITVEAADSSYTTISYVQHVAEDDSGPLTMMNWSYRDAAGTNAINVDPLVLATQVRAARETGVTAIFMKSRQLSQDTALLPLLGYDASLADLLAEVESHTLPNEFADVRSLSDLLATPTGRLWYTDNVQHPRFVFDVTDESYSMQTLDAYLRERYGRGISS